MTFWTYILRCSDDSYYTGHTSKRVSIDIEAGRLTVTQKTPARNVGLEPDFASRVEALDAKRRIKGWTRTRKEALMAGDGNRLSVLARNHQDESGPSTASGQTD